MKKYVLFIIIIIGLFVIAGCSSSVEDSNEASEDASVDGSLSFLDIEFSDVNTGVTHKISDFAGKKVLVESFAVWCPTCTRQQQVIGELHDQLGDQVVSISLDTDPNEDVEKVKEHTQRHGFDWIYAVSPRELTQSLIDTFGVGVVNAPSAPVVLVCEDQSFRLMQRGLKDLDELRQEIERGC
jgi:thiol-disulfide isomerase/thioredoxin